MQSETTNPKAPSPGLIAFLGSGETAAAGGLWFDQIASSLSAPLQAAILELPAGFEPNSQRVAQRVADYLAVRLQNFHPVIATLPIRKRATTFSPDEAEVCEPLYYANLMYMGAGSPTYTARQLHQSLAWSLIQARQRLGAALGLASAAAIASGSHVLPVYEIFKAGIDPHWQPGLNLLAPYGLHITVISHWNNSEGGAELDTSRCFIGQERFNQLTPLLPSETVILGLDEHTGLILDFSRAEGSVLGRDRIHIIRDGSELSFSAGQRFPLHLLGDYHPLTDPGVELPPDLWQRAVQIAHALPESKTPPPEVQELAARRESARQARDWLNADRIRAEINGLGWTVKDTPAGPQLEAID